MKFMKIERLFDACLMVLRKRRANNILARLQRDAVARGLDRLTIEEIDAEIAASRRERNAKVTS